MADEMMRIAGRYENDGKGYAKGLAVDSKGQQYTRKAASEVLEHQFLYRKAADSDSEQLSIEGYLTGMITISGLDPNARIYANVSPDGSTWSTLKDYYEAETGDAKPFMSGKRTYYINVTGMKYASVSVRRYKSGEVTVSGRFMSDPASVSNKVGLAGNRVDSVDNSGTTSSNGDFSPRSTNEIYFDIDHSNAKVFDQIIGMYNNLDSPVTLKIAGIVNFGDGNPERRSAYFLEKEIPVSANIVLTPEKSQTVIEDDTHYLEEVVELRQPFSFFRVYIKPKEAPTKGTLYFRQYKRF